MEEILQKVDKILAKIEAKRKEDETSAQRRVDILSALLKRAKENNCVIMVGKSNGKGDRLHIMPVGEVVVNGIFMRDDVLQLAHTATTPLGQTLAALIRGEMEVAVFPQKGLLIRRDC